MNTRSYGHFAFAVQFATRRWLGFSLGTHLLYEPIYDQSGDVVAWLKGTNIHDLDGNHLAVLNTEHVYGHDGQHLGLLKSRLFRDHDGGVVAFMKGGRGGPILPIPSIPPIPPIPSIPPIPAIPSIPPIPAIPSLGWGIEWNEFITQ